MVRWRNRPAGRSATVPESAEAGDRSARGRSRRAGVRGPESIGESLGAAQQVAEMPTTVAWPSGPPPAAVIEAVRTLEVSISRRVDGTLHGNYQGITPGHGSEPGESRVYQPGDDVRRIDWNVTARTAETYVRDQVADRDLEAWLVVDVSAAMRFGTTSSQKSQIGLAAAACVGFLTVRTRNRVGAVLVAGPHLKIMPPRGGRDQVRAILTAAASPPPSERLGRADLTAALDRIAKLSRRRGFVTVIADFPVRPPRTTVSGVGDDDPGADWADALTRLGLRHDLLAIPVHDPRERDVPPVGYVTVADPATGRERELRVTAEVQRRFAELAARAAEHQRRLLDRAGADVIELDTESDWLAEIIGHVRRRRVQAVNVAAIRTSAGKPR